ncbi:MAG: glycoside hydrolase family 78 protein [Arachidicoccus sp.]|nr:glycoside hydrolase family 78 protein [Arachidicoccus sp.]
MLTLFQVNAKALSHIWNAKWIEIGYNESDDSSAAQYFRKVFSAKKDKKEIKSAILYITSRGMYEAEINGHRVGNDYLTPGWTSYSHRIQYQQFDVAALLHKGQNAVGITIGNGWYRGKLAWGEHNKNHYGHTLALLSQLEIIYKDGTKETINTDDSWRSSTGSIVSAEIYDGETIDDRLEKTGWANAGYNDRDWSSVKIVDYDFSNLIPTENEPVRKHETFNPVKIITTPKGEKVIDFGQNLVGWVIVKANGQAGTKITLQHAEVLDKNGNFYNTNYRGAKATATYILKGGQEETFEPHFTFYGFRYIKIEGYPGNIKPGDFTAVALYSDMKPSGTFECSDSLLNKLQHNIQWGQRGNFLDVPTDCPQRDERLGWTGDAQVFSLTAAYNRDVKNFFSKWLKDVAADQLPDGAVPFVIPNVLGGNDAGSAGWSDVATIIPWNMYMVYGDEKILKQQYASMKAWVEYMHSKSVNNLWSTGFHFGDWLFYRPDDDDDGRSAVTDKYLIAQCFYANSVQILINTAQVIGKTDDVQTYTALLNAVKKAFLKEYVTPNGRLVSSTQTAYVLALQFDMLPEELRAQAAKRLVENVHDYDDHLTTGFLGTPYLCEVLSRFGYSDIAYKLLLQKTYPSWLYPVLHGATTIWERWDGQKPDGSFENPGMNSFNHYSYGAIGNWMYRNIAGIQPAEPGYKKIIIKPLIGGGLTWAKGSYNSTYGLIVSEWHITDNKVKLHVEIPQGTTAEIYVPTADGKYSEKKEVNPGKYDFEE